MHINKRGLIGRVNEKQQYCTAMIIYRLKVNDSRILEAGRGRVNTACFACHDRRW